MATTKLGQLMWKCAIVCILATVSSQLMIINEVNGDQLPPVVPGSFPRRRQGDPECWIEQGSKYTKCDFPAWVDCSNRTQQVCEKITRIDAARVKSWLNPVNEWNKCLRDNRMSNQAFIMQMVLEDWVYMKLVIDFNIHFTREDGMPELASRRAGESPRDTNWKDNLRSNTNFRPSNLGSTRGGSSPRRVVDDKSQYDFLVSDMPKPKDFYKQRQRRIDKRERMSKNEIAECMKIKSKHEQIFQDDWAELVRKYPEIAKPRRAQLPVDDHDGHDDGFDNSSSSSYSLRHKTRTGRRHGRGRSARQLSLVTYPEYSSYSGTPSCHVTNGYVDCGFDVITNCQGFSNTTTCSHLKERDELWAGHMISRQFQTYLYWDNLNDNLWNFNATYQLITKAHSRRMALLDPYSKDIYLSYDSCNPSSKYVNICNDFYKIRTREYQQSYDKYEEEWPKVLATLQQIDYGFWKSMEQIDIKYYGQVRRRQPVVWRYRRELPSINRLPDFTKPDAKVLKFPFRV